MTAASTSSVTVDGTASLVRSFDEDVVDLHLTDHSDERNADQKHGNRPERNAVEDRADHSLTSTTTFACSSRGKNRCRIFVAVTDAVAPHSVAMIVVGMIAV